MDRVQLRKKEAVDAIIQREVELLQKRHPQLSEADAYSKLFAEHPEFYEAYVTTASIVGRNGDEE
mgnify:CR=1 FL=1